MCSSLSGVGGEATLEGEKEPPDLSSWEYVSRSVEGVGCGTVAPPVGQFLALQLESEITVGGTTTRQVEGVSERLLDVRAVISFDANDNVEDVDLVCFGRRRLCHFCVGGDASRIIFVARGYRPRPTGSPWPPADAGRPCLASVPDVCALHPCRASVLGPWLPAGRDRDGPRRLRPRPWKIGGPRTSREFLPAAPLVGCSPRWLLPR